MSREAMILRPMPGLRILDPATKQPVPADGIRVNRSGPFYLTFWHRRIKDGSMTVHEPPQTTPAAESKE